MRRSSSKRIPGSVRTQYNGRYYRSRLEARTAALLDALGMKMTYEAKSLLIPGTEIAYTVDFTDARELTYVEARGYKSNAGEAQIQAFSQYLPPAASYFVLSPDGCRAWSDGEWGPLVLKVGDLKFPVSCENSHIYFTWHGVKLSWVELEQELQKEGKTIKGGALARDLPPVKKAAYSKPVVKASTVAPPRSPQRDAHV